MIEGKVHNDDPAAGELWMPPGSFWTQPKGELHVTSSKGASMALVEIDMGPYLVLPREEAFDSGERAINVHASNLVWVDAPGAPPGTKVAYLWGSLEDSRHNGTFLKLPPGGKVALRPRSGSLRAVVVSGAPSYRGERLPPGSYFGSRGAALHELSAPEESVLYLRAEGRYELAPR